MAIKSVRSVRCSDGKREMTIDEFKRWLKKFDDDRDGRISKAELREVVRATGGWFARWKGSRALRSADANGDGFIDENEMKNLAEFAFTELGVRLKAK